MKEKTCCFIGHRKTSQTVELEFKLAEIVERLIVEENVDTFLFGSRSEFDDLCYYIVAEAKKVYPHIKRIYVRAEYPNIPEHYEKYLLGNFEETYYPEHVLGSGKAVYIERNYEMIDKSEFCVIYYREEEAPTTRKSGTKIALDYAVRKRKNIIRV